jgi:hypothetical protein
MTVPTEMPEIAYPCRIPGSLTIHLTTGTVDGKRGETLCGIAMQLFPTDATLATCRQCTDRQLG